MRHLELSVVFMASIRFMVFMVDVLMSAVFPLVVQVVMVRRVSFRFFSIFLNMRVRIDDGGCGLFVGEQDAPFGRSGRESKGEQDG